MARAASGTEPASRPASACSHHGITYAEGSRVKIAGHWFRCLYGSWRNDDAPLASLLPIAARG